MKWRIPPKRTQPIRGKMNKTEAKYACEVLDMQKAAGEILDYKFEAVRFKLAPNTTYTPDFFVVYLDHFEIIEVKGYWEEDARVKIKVFNELYPWFVVKAVKYVKKQWIYEEFK